MGVRPIEKTLFQFIWKHSKRDQFILLAVTTALFPFLFLTLELPKRIINDAIGAQSSQIPVLGAEFNQITFLWILCGAFLFSVLVHGLLKMRINTMKGVLSERMLRRLRFSLIARMQRFPKSYFQRTSQGELVAMITGETEPMGGLMGDALTQPVLQAGQMLTILLFLFLQSFWFGLAAIALIPLQAWLIPKLQRQINLMNKERIKEVRQLAAVIGESAAGAGELRTHGGWRYRLAMVTERLGVVYHIRFRIYQKKFFMKFVNNFITQLTPFFFFSVGGYLVIQGAVSLGALVAALAAYKDLSSPWKELLAYYNQAQDMSLRWETVVEKFSPNGVIEERLVNDTPADTPNLDGPISLRDVDVVDADGTPVLENITFDIAPGGLVGIAAPSEVDRQALADVLTRELLPVSGSVQIGDIKLNDLHQSTIAGRIGHANSHPVLFRGSFGDNILMGVRNNPIPPTDAAGIAEVQEALTAGNSGDLLTGEWLNPGLAGAADASELRNWCLNLLEGIGSSGPLFRRSLDQAIDHSLDEDLQRKLVDIRPKVWDAVRAAKLQRFVHRFDPRTYNPALPVASNLFYATRRRPMSQQELLKQDGLFEQLRDLDLENILLNVSRDVIELLSQIFGTDGTEHPLFRKLGLDAGIYEKAVVLVRSLADKPIESMDAPDKALLMTFPMLITAEQIGPAFAEDMRRDIIAQRDKVSGNLDGVLSDLYAPINPDMIGPGLSVLENALFGKLSDSAGGRADELRKIVSQVLEDEGLKTQVIELIFDLPLGLNGGNLPAVFAEPLAIARAAVKRPDILILEQTLASYDLPIRVSVHKNLRKLLPNTTLIYISDSFEDPSRFDQFIEIAQGRLVSADKPQDVVEDTAATADLQRKVRALESTDLFGGMSRKQLRLLAFGAKWFHAAPGEVIFNKDDDPTDGAYMILEGSAELINPRPDGEDQHIASVGPGTLVGELGLIRNVPRALTMRAETEVEALRLGAEEFLAVVENDAATAFKLLQVVAGYTS